MSIYRGAGGASDTTDQATVTEVTQKAAEAAASATSAASSASDAANSATTASTAASTATSNASTSTTNATNAAASASTASTAATNASNSATAAAASETNAAASAAAALASSTSASNSAASATSSASAAGTSASAAQSAYADTLAIQGAAATSATNAATSATAAAASATAAATSATTAATEASNAATSATSSATYSTLAAGHAASAEAAEAATLALFDQFGDQYLGAISADPITDNGGDALTVGDVYFNTTDNVLKFYNGTSWTAPEDVASTAAANALASQTAAATSATSAATSASQASASASAASSSASSASTSATNASNSAASAAASETSASGHKDLAYTYWQNAASAVTYSDLEAIAASKAVTAVDVFVYDTRKDSDGGAWRKRTQHTSWYNETLNTATRGARKEFPAVAVIVAEASKVTIYDGDDPTLPMWMVLIGSSIYTGAYIHKAVSALNGVISLVTDQTATHSGLVRINMINEESRWFRNTGSSIRGTYNTEITSLYPNTGWVVINDATYSLAHTSGSVNDVAMTVLPNAPIDSATGLPTPTIAVATNGGVSVIKDDGTVVDSAVTSTCRRISFDDVYRIHVDFSAAVAYPLFYVYEIYAADGFTEDARYGASGTRDLYLPNGVTNTTPVDGSNYGTVGGLALLDENTTTPSEGMVSYITSSYNTGWLHGDVKGAFLSDTTAETVGVDETTELVTNGTFDTDLSGWTDKSTGTGTATWSSTGGGTTALYRLDVNNVGWIEQAVTTVVGKTYTVSVEYDSGTADVALFVGTTSGGSDISGSSYNLSKTAGSVTTFDFVATSTTTYVGFRNSTNAATAYIDNISVKQTGNLVVNGTFDVDTSGWTDNTHGTLSVVSGAMRVTNVSGISPASGYQAITLQANTPYVFSADIIAISTVSAQFTVNSDTGVLNILAGSSGHTTTGTKTFTYTPSSTGTYYIHCGHRGDNSAGKYIDIDNISVRLAEEDRSVNNNGLEVHGQITKAAVATGADLVAYSGFSADNYLEQPYNSDLDFGAGDFYVMGWVTKATGTNFIFDRQDGLSSIANRFNFYITDSSIGNRCDSTNVSTSYTFTTGQRYFVAVVRSSGTDTFYVNGSSVGTAAQTGNVTDVSASYPLTIAADGSSKLSFPTNIALLRIGAGAPTAADILKIYNDERPLFTDGAQATLFGSSDAVTALAFDPVTDLLSVGTSAGRSDFSGLRRVSNTTTAVTTAISAYDSLIIEQ